MRAPSPFLGTGEPARGGLPVGRESPPHWTSPAPSLLAASLTQERGPAGRSATAGEGALLRLSDRSISPRAETDCLSPGSDGGDPGKHPAGKPRPRSVRRH